MTKSVHSALPDAPPGWRWDAGQETRVTDRGNQTTAWFHLRDRWGIAHGSGRIAVDLYGWDAVTSRATTLIREATA